MLESIDHWNWIQPNHFKFQSGEFSWWNLLIFSNRPTKLLKNVAGSFHYKVLISHFELKAINWHQSPELGDQSVALWRGRPPLLLLRDSIVKVFMKINKISMIHNVLIHTVLLGLRKKLSPFQSTEYWRPIKEEAKYVKIELVRSRPRVCYHVLRRDNTANKSCGDNIQSVSITVAAILHRGFDHVTEPSAPNSNS